ncbi:MAG: molybdenum cofactor biosynthesis protein MoaE [Kiritimatiellia bacterium]
MFLLSSEALDPAALRQRLQRPDAGALTVFEGWVRNHHQGLAVLSLEYEAAPELCQSEGDRLLADARAQFDILDVLVAHRTGHLAIGDIAVWIGVASGHRDTAFAACRFLIDEIKVRLPIWKKEHYARGGATWIGAE